MTDTPDLEHAIIAARAHLAEFRAQNDYRPDVGACYRVGLLDGARRAEQDARDRRPTDAIADDLTLEAKHYGETAQKGLQSHRAYRALLLGTARGYRHELP